MESEPRGRMWDATWGEYLSEVDRWSNTTLKAMSDDDPQTAWLKQTNQLAAPRTRAKTTGSVHHAIFLEGPDAFAKRYLVCDRRTKKGKEAAAEAEADGVQPITASEYETAISMAEAVVQDAERRAADGDTFLRDLIAASGRIEQSLVWQDSETGLPLKGRADKLIEGAHVIADLKTTSSWRSGWDFGQWDRHAYEYRYHRQAALYLDAYRAAFGHEARFIMVVVHSKPPHQVTVREFGEAEIDLGLEESREQMRRVLDHYERGVWLSPEQHSIVRTVFDHRVFERSGEAA